MTLWAPMLLAEASDPSAYSFKTPLFIGIFFLIVMFVIIWWLRR